MAVPTTTKDTADTIAATLIGKKCWHVSCGGAAVNTFQLALGAKIRRAESISLRGRADEFDQFEGEANLLVWCTWRLDTDASPLSSSDDVQENVVAALQRLVGHKVANVQVDLPGWDLRIDFSGGLRLRVFCDHVPGDPSFDGNWDLFLPDRIFSVGVGSQCESETR
jgi:hypothetical protein